MIAGCVRREAATAVGDTNRGYPSYQRRGCTARHPQGPGDQGHGACPDPEPASHCHREAEQQVERHCSMWPLIKVPGGIMLLPLLTRHIMANVILCPNVSGID